MNNVKLKSLKRITNSLKDVFAELKNCGLQDHVIRHRYAEFFVTFELRSRGHNVQLLGKREDKSADIYLPDKKKRVEIKSGKCDEDKWAYASFGKGKQIRAKKFDYCVFVTFACNDETVQDVLIFTRKELQEVTKFRKHVAAHESTNPCLFMYARNFNELTAWTSENGIKAFKIEKKVHRNPKKFRYAWNKIQ